MKSNFLSQFIRYKKYQHIIYKKYKSPRELDKINEDHIEKLKNDGFIIIENYFSKEKCLKLINILDDFMMNNKDKIWIDPNFSDNRIYGAENISLSFREKVNESVKLTKQIGEQYLNQDIDLYMIMANKVIFKDENLGSGQGWHKDSYTKQFKSIIYLNDVDTNNGPLQIIRNSRSDIFMLKTFYKLKNKFPSTRFSDDEINLILDNKNQIVELTADAGSLILFDSSLIHRGKKLVNKIRYALTNYYFRKSDFENHKGHFSPLLDKI